MAEGPQFNLKEYGESILHAFPKATTEQLSQMSDFKKAFEINSELAQVFKEVGISEDMGPGGLTPSNWPEFGPVQKTLAEFKNAYDSFQEEMVTLLQKIRRGKPSAPSRRKGRKRK